jgi:predicted transcriptional regulator
VAASIGHHTVRAFASRHPSLARRSSVCRSNLIREAVADHIETGFAQAERGELIDGDAAVEMLRQRRAARLKP